MEKPGQESALVPDPHGGAPHAGKEDRVYLSSRREALVVLAVFLVAMAWSVGYSYLFGYHGDLSRLTFVLGFPSWVFWGVVVPWAVCIGISVFFGAYFVRDEDLGEESPTEGAATAEPDGAQEQEPGHA